MPNTSRNDSLQKSQVSGSQATNNTNRSTANLSLDILMKLLPEPFDGNRQKVRSFIKQVDSVFEVAQEDQILPLLILVKNKIVGPAQEELDIHCNLTTWAEISNLLLQLYSERKPLDQLFEELTSSQQGKNETVTQYYQRLEDTRK